MSIVIPVYNEEAILRSAVIDLVDRLQQEFAWSYELLLAENGSTDRTTDIAMELSERFGQIRCLHTGAPNYGAALRQGMIESRGTFVICDEIDLCDTDFYQRALALLDASDADLVIGSKRMQGASDERPLFRRMGTLVINGLLRVALGFKGSYTHGLKAFRRQALTPTIDACLVDKDLFASEFVIRAGRSGVPVQEIPVRVLEKRPPSIGLVRRVPSVLSNLLRLVVAIRFKR